MWRNGVNAWLNWGWRTFWSGQTITVGSGFFVQKTAKHPNVFSFLFLFIKKTLLATDRKRLQDRVTSCLRLCNTLRLMASRYSFIICPAYSFIDLNFCVKLFIWQHGGRELINNNNYYCNHYHRLKMDTAIFTFSGLCIVIYLLDKDQQVALFFPNLFEKSILYLFWID
jgi:hypothetical protein